MPLEKTEEYLAQEYNILQQIIETFDGRALTIKAWSVTFSTGGLGIAYQQENPVLLLVAAGSALVFWMVEAIWKLDQRAFIPRIRRIEAWFAKNSADPKAAPFQISSQCERSVLTALTGTEGRRAAPAWLRALLVPFHAGVMLPHVVVAAAGVLLYCYAPPA